MARKLYLSGNMAAGQKFKKGFSVCNGTYQSHPFCLPGECEYAKSARKKLGWVNSLQSLLAARGSQEAGFTQPSLCLFLHICKFVELPSKNNTNSTQACFCVFVTVHVVVLVGAASLFIHHPSPIEHHYSSLTWVILEVLYQSIVDEASNTSASIRSDIE